MGDDLDLAVTDLGDLDGLAEVADAALNLDLLVQELLEGGDIEDLVARGLRGVDDELKTKGGPISDCTKPRGNNGYTLSKTHLLRRLRALLGASLLLFVPKEIDLAYCFTP